jgi:hypothetical protein
MINQSKFLYKFLSVDHHEDISKEIYRYIVEKTDILDKQIFWNSVNVEKILEFIPLLKEYLVAENLTAKSMAIICTPAKTQGYIHIDAVPDIRILWPIKNCKGSITKFFDIDDSYVKLDYLENGVPYMNITHPGPYTQLGEFELTEPVLFNPGIGHGIYTDPEITELRISFTIKI